MKRLALPSALLGLTVLLTACPNPTPPEVTYGLTVAVTGVTSAPVTVTNTTTGAQVFQGTVEGTKTFGGLKAGSVLKVEGGAVNTYTTPAPQTVTLERDTAVTLSYVRAVTPVNADLIAGPVIGNTLRLGTVTLFDVVGGRRVASGTVDTTNRLNLPLGQVTPSAESLFTGYYGSDRNCTGTNTAPDARLMISSSLAAYSTEGDRAGDILEVATAGTGIDPQNNIVLRVYSDRALTVAGTCQLALPGGATTTDDVDFTLRQGWNVLVFTRLADGTFTTRNAGADVQTELRFVQAQPRVAVVLSPSTLDFGDKDTLTVDAAFSRVGGYNGPVTLSTDLPGLTVEPASVTLPPLPTLSAASTPTRSPLDAALRHLAPNSLTAQAHRTPLTFRYTGQSLSNQPFTLIVKDPNGQQVGQGRAQLNATRAGLGLYTYGSVIVPRGQTRQPEVIVYTQNVTYSGPVEVTGLQVPAGFTVTPSTLTMNGTSAYGSVSITAAPDVAPGRYEVILQATGGSYTTTAKLTVEVPKPSVAVSIASGTVDVTQGGSSFVEVSVTSLDSFAGKTTVSLADLPAGVSASPVTVEVTAGTTTTVRIPVTASSAANLGKTTVRVTTADAASTPGYTPSFTLNVIPGRVAVTGQTSNNLIPSGDVTWLGSSTSNYDSSTGQSFTTVTVSAWKGLILQRTTEFKVPGYTSAQFVGTGDGAVLVLLDGNRARRVQVDGTVSELTNPLTLGRFAERLDAQGRLWLVETASSGTGGLTHSLKYWDTTTGAVVTVDSTRSYGYSAPNMTQSANGRFLLISGNEYGKSLVLVDTTSGSVTDLPLKASSYLPAAVSNDGAVWAFDYGALKRVNADGTVTSFQTGVYFDRLLGFDQVASVLWGSNTGNVYAIDLSTGAVQAYPVGSSNSVADGIPQTAGGITVLLNAYDTSTGRTISYLSRLP